MTGYKYRDRPGFTNFDYGFWDEVSNSHWHATTTKRARPTRWRSTSPPAPSSPMSSRSPGETRFGYPDFDREIFGVGKAENYDPTKAQKPNLTSPRFMGPSGKPDPTIERVFRGKATLKRGSPAGAVRIVQQALADLGKYDLGDFGPAGDGVDGKYGDKTSDAVKQFKVNENLGSQSDRQHQPRGHLPAR